MKTKTTRQLSIKAAVFLFGIALFCGVRTLAQYAIDWHTIDGGGGTSTGGVFSVNGTIGQPDAGQTMAGGIFTLTGGFWAINAIQTEGAPWLSIEVSGPGEATISWEPEEPGWILQEATNLTNDWSNSASGSTNPIVVPTAVPIKFYRLSFP